MPLDKRSSGFLLLTEIGTLLDTVVERAGIRRYEIISTVRFAFVSRKNL
jgi:hypothetical protein